MSFVVVIKVVPVSLFDGDDSSTSVGGGVMTDRIGKHTHANVTCALVHAHRHVQ